MPSLSSLFVDLKANTADFVSGMSTASYAAKKAGRDINDSFSQLGAIAQKALAPLGEVGSIIGSSFASIAAAAGAAGEKLATLGSINVAGTFASAGASAIGAAAALAAFAVKGSEVVENLERISEKTGISVRDLQVFGAAGESVGVSLEDVVTGMRKFDQVLTGTGRGSSVLQATLKALGVTAKDNQGALLQLADAFQGIEDGPRKDAIAVELLGRSGLNLIPILNEGRQGIESFQSIISEFGPTITSSAIKATEDWNKSTLELSESWKSVEVNLTGEIIPALADFTSKIAVAIKFWSDLQKEIHDSSQGPMVTLPGGEKVEAKIGRPATAQERGESGLGPTVGNDQIALANSIATSQAAAAMASVAKQKSSYKDLFDFLAAGGKEQLEMQHLRENLEEAIALEDYKQAAAIEGQIGALQATIKYEQERQRINEEIAKQIAKQNIGELPQLKITRPAFPQPAVPNIDFGTPFGAPADEAAAAANEKASSQFDKMISDYHAGQSDVADFWKSYGSAATNTLSSINAEYDDQKANWYDLLGSQEISQKQFDDISVQLEKNRMEAVVGMYEAQEQEAAKLDELALKDPWTPMADKFKAFANQIELEGQDLGPKIFSSMSKAVDDVSTQLAKFVVTGKSNFKQLFESLEESVAKAGFQKIFSSIAAPLAGVPPGNQTGKTVGSTSIIGSLFNSGGGNPNAPGGTPGTFKGPLSFLSTLFNTKNQNGQGGAGKLLGAAAGANGSAASPFYVIEATGALAGAAVTPGTDVGSTSVIGSLFGGAKSGGGILGSGAADGSESNPFYTVAVDSSGNQLFGAGSDFSSLFGSSDSSSSSSGSSGMGLADVLGMGFGGDSGDSGSGSGSGGSASGIISSIIGIAALFGGAMAGGGDVSPGKAYLVGENHPEFFVPRQSGSIVPSLKTQKSAPNINLSLHVHGVSDADSFQRSQSQIMSRMHRELEVARGRG